MFPGSLYPYSPNLASRLNVRFADLVVMAERRETLQR